MLEIKITCPELAAAEKVFAEADAYVESILRQAATLAARELHSEVWGRFPRRTGAPVRALEPFAETGGGRVRFGVRARGAEQVIRYVELGTRPHMIRARTARALRFTQRGRTIFARSAYHPGTRAQRVFERALRDTQPRVRRIFQGALGQVGAYLARRR
ncbi:MAG: hypothetical protein HY321_14470 [Armatimonadetes bacterium]|nr:hypothetical protein [Armatimonadota bacterium]